MIYLSLKNNIDIQIDTDDYDVLRHIYDQFTYFEDGYYWTYRYQSGTWDGKVSLFNTAKRVLPYGLFLELYKFLKKENYLGQVKIDDDLKKLFKNDINNIDITYDLKFQPYDYQQDIIEDALKKTKGIYVAATGSGKSLIITYIIKNLYINNLTKKHIIIVPTTSLIEQFYYDLIDYGIDEELLGIANKDKKQFEKTIVISTWQVLQNRIKEIKNFDLVMCDEVHLVKAKVLSKIMKNCGHMTYRYGVTGTMPNNYLDKDRVISYIGPVWKTYKTSELANQGYLSTCNIKHIKIRYTNKIDGDYKERKDKVFKNEYRLQLMKGIINKTNNTLILVERVAEEGEFLENYLKENIKGKTVVFLSGRDKPKVREEWRQKMENDGNIVMIATYGIFSTGINVKSLKNVIIASSSKSKIRILQSIGRSLRKNANKENGAYIWDLWDQIKGMQSHGNSRERFYIKEAFNIETIEMHEKRDKNINKLFENI